MLYDSLASLDPVAHILHKGSESEYLLSLDESEYYFKWTRTGAYRSHAGQRHYLNWVRFSRCLLRCRDVALDALELWWGESWPSLLYIKGSNVCVAFSRYMKRERALQTYHVLVGKSGSHRRAINGIKSFPATACHRMERENEEANDHRLNYILTAIICKRFSISPWHPAAVMKMMTMMMAGDYILYIIALILFSLKCGGGHYHKLYYKLT